jgi:hypothetical protein
VSLADDVGDPVDPDGGQILLQFAPDARAG